MSKKIIIPRENLQKLYWDERKSSIEIGKLYHCHPMTVRNRIQELDILKKSASDARIHYEKRNFSKNNIEKAYLLGFRLGDLSVYKTSLQSEVVVVRCHTTQMVQVTLIKKLFSPYGHVTVSESKYGYNINCYVNTTFLFLLPKHKQVPKHVKNAITNSYAFIAGYVDAEGYFAINQGRARFKIDSYDVNILAWINTVFERSSIRGKFRRIALQGQPQYRIGIFHRDLWRLEINESQSLYRFIRLIGLYLQHEKRKADMIKCLNNIMERKKNGSIL